MCIKSCLTFVSFKCIICFILTSENAQKQPNYIVHSFKDPISCSNIDVEGLDFIYYGVTHAKIEFCITIELLYMAKELM